MLDNHVCRDKVKTLIPKWELANAPNNFPPYSWMHAQRWKIDIDPYYVIALLDQLLFLFCAPRRQDLVTAAKIEPLGTSA